MRITPEHGVIEIGSILWGPAIARTRVATEALFLFARYVFDALGYRRFEWKCNARNAPSMRAARRFGFTYEGIFRQHMVVKGENRDTAWFSIIDGEWPALAEAFEPVARAGELRRAGPAEGAARGPQAARLAAWITSRRSSRANPAPPVPRNASSLQPREGWEEFQDRATSSSVNPMRS